MFVIAFLFTLNSILIAFVFKPEPSKEGIIIEVDDQNTAVAQ
jgi:hypothetical protein